MTVLAYHLLIPGLDRGQGVDLPPALGRFMALGDRHTTKGQDYETRVAELLGLGSDTGEVPAAAVCRSALGLPLEGSWLCASPVYLEVGIEKIILNEFDNGTLGAEQAEALVDTFNRHFHEDGLELEIGRDNLWFLRLPEGLGIQTRPLSEVRGGSIYPHLPGGDKSAYWHRLMNELQMLFHDHPVNLKREQTGLRPVNGIWFWGEGDLTGPVRTNWDQVVTDELIAQGLAGLGGIPCRSTNHAEPRAEGRVLVVDISLHKPAANGDFEAWNRALIRLEERWFATLCLAWNARRLRSLVIEGDETVVEIGPRSWWRFWQRC